MRILLPFPIVVPLIAAALSLLTGRLQLLQRIVGVSVVTACLAAGVAILVHVEREGPTSVQLGGWPAPLGITLVADLFSAILLVVSTAMVLAVLVFAIGSRTTQDTTAFFHPVYLVLAAGVAASLLTGDLFNLFVAFEVMLVASYVLITLDGSRDQVRSGMTYVVISLLASLLFITAIGLVYAATGTVNLAQLSERMGDLPSGLVTAMGLLFLIVFGIKAAIFPLFFWLPDSYPTAPSPVTAIFAGLLTKIGVYAIIRTQTLLFPVEGGPSQLLLWVAGLTMVVGVLGAIAQNDMKRILSFHIVSQIGYMVLGLALFTVAGVAGAIYYMIHNIVAKTGLLLNAGLVEEATGTAALRRLGGLVHRAPVVAILFAIPALSLAGIPPFSGFLAKLALVDAGSAAGEYAIVGVSLAVSLLTLFSMTKIWGGVFWGTPEEPTPALTAPDEGHLRLPALMIVATAGVALLSVALAVAGALLFDLSTEAGITLLDRSAYVDEVLGR